MNARYIRVESPDTGKTIEIWECDESEVQDACAYVGERYPYDTVRLLPACFKPLPTLTTWRY